MLAMNYQLTLPQSFDMEALRERIPQIGARFDDLPGLGFKAFLFRKQGKNGSPVNQYAPFYVWNDQTAANRFLWEGGGFDGVVRAYGRPIVQTWLTTRGRLRGGCRIRSHLGGAACRTGARGSRARRARAGGVGSRR